MNKEVPSQVETYCLYGYWRSSASWRCRWALSLKGIDYTQQAVNLLAGEHKGTAHLARHPAGRVPVLEITLADGTQRYLRESMAIVEYLDELYADRGAKIFSGDAWQRAQIRSLCECINASTAPLQIPAVQKRHAPTDSSEQMAWALHFIREGLSLYQNLMSGGSGSHSVGDTLSAADLFLIPQIYNAIRYGVDMDKEFPKLQKIYSLCMAEPLAHANAPEQQSDAPI